MTFNTQRAHSGPLYLNLGLIKFNDMIQYHNVLFIHNIFHCVLPVSVLDTYAIDFTHAYKTRGNDIGLLNLPMYNTVSFGKNSIRYQSLSSWNSLQLLHPSTKFVNMKPFELKNLLKKLFMTTY